MVFSSSMLWLLNRHQTESWTLPRTHQRAHVCEHECECTRGFTHKTPRLVESFHRRLFEPSCCVPGSRSWMPQKVRCSFLVHLEFRRCKGDAREGSEQGRSDYRTVKTVCTPRGW